MFIQFFQYEFLAASAIQNKELLYLWTFLVPITCRVPAFFCPMVLSFSKEFARFVSTSIQIARWLANRGIRTRSNDGATIAPCLFYAQSRVPHPRALYYAAEVDALSSLLHPHTLLHHHKPTNIRTLYYGMKIVRCFIFKIVNSRKASTSL